MDDKNDKVARARRAPAKTPPKVAGAGRRPPPPIPQGAGDGRGRVSRSGKCSHLGVSDGGGEAAWAAQNTYSDLLRGEVDHVTVAADDPMLPLLDANAS